MRKLKLFIVLLGVMLLGMQTVQAKKVIMERLKVSTYIAQNGDTLMGELYGTSHRYQILIAKDATVTLFNLSIYGFYDLFDNDKQWAGITCLGNAKIVLVGKNYVSPFGDKYPAIWIKKGYELTIQGDGSLEADHLNQSDGFGGAGIGGGREHPAGHITIKSGNIIATGAAGGAGIGSGQGSSCEGVDIFGGTVYARGASGGAGIGTGLNGSCGEIWIGKKAHVKAKRIVDMGACSIGEGVGGHCTDIFIGGVLMKEVIKDSPFRFPDWDGNLATLEKDDLEKYTTARDGMTIYGELKADVKVNIAAGATVTLDNVTIKPQPCLSCAGLTCFGNATIRLKGDNRVRGFSSFHPGIEVPRGYTLTIEEAKGGGSLHAECNNLLSSGLSAGIGGAYEDYAGNIVIHSGTITAIGGTDGGAGIGAAHMGTIGNITIDGGTVTATGGKMAAGIGGAYQTYCGMITITNDVNQVVATRGKGANTSIGKGYPAGSFIGTITIGGTIFPNGTAEETFIFPYVCEQPTNVAGTTTITSATITWDAPADQDKWTVCYHVRNNPKAIKEIECTKTECTLNDLEPETEYVVWVSVSCIYNSTAQSEKITVKTQPKPCNPPTDLTVSDVTTNSAVVSWKNADGVKGHVVRWRKTSESEFEHGELAGIKEFYTLTDLEENTEYFVQVTSVCGGKEGDNPTTVTFTTKDSPCYAVKNVFSSNITQTSAIVAWNPGDSEKEWWVYLYSDVATYKRYHVYDDPTITFTDLKPGHKYRVRIKAICDETHSSELSDFYDFETDPVLCLEAKNVTVSEITENSAKITWERDGDNQDAFKIEYIEWAPPYDKTFIEDITGTSYTLTGLKPGTTYKVSVRGVCGDQTTIIAEYKTFTTEEHICRTPRNFRVLGTSTATEIKLLWELSKSGEKDFELSWKKASEADYGAAQAVNGQTYTITAEAGTKYDIRIRTVCADGYSEYVTIQYTTPAAAPTCKAPKNLVRYGNATYNSFVISWTAGDEADTQWQVAYKAAEDDDYTLLTATEKPFTVSGLEPETEYTVQVRTVCGEDEYSNWSAERTITTASLPCAAPSTPMVVGDPTYNSATITWTAGSEFQTRWKIYYKASSEADYRDPIEVDAATYTFTELQPLTSYNVRVSGICGGKESSKSGSATFTTAAKEPDCKKVSDIHVVGEAGAEEVTLGWTAGGDEVAWLVEYELSTDVDKFTEVTTMNNPVKLTGLEPSTTYFVRVRALCGELGEGEPASANFTTAALKPCVAPTVELSYATSFSAEVLITPGTADQKQWVVQWKRTDETGTYTAVTEYIEHQLTDLDDNTEYEVWAYAVCDGKNSDLSDKVTFTTKKECRAPKDVNVTDMTASTAYVTWTEGDYDQTKFTVYYEKYGSGIWKNVDVASTHCLLTGLAPETEYHLQVRVACSEGSGWSDMVNFTTEGPCEAPTNVKASAVTHESVTISWTAGAGQTAWTYEVVLASTETVIASGRTETASVDLDALAPEMEYKVRVKSACGSLDESDYSAWASFTTDKAPYCAEPTNGKASNVTARTATITWTAGGDETKWYVIYYDDEGLLSGSEPATATTFELTGLEPKTHYTVNIVAECGPDFYSGWSDMIEFTTAEEVAPCLAPSAIKTVSDPTPTTAELTWTVNQPGQSEWVLEYRSEDETDFHAVTVTALPYTLTGLQEHTRYDVRVKGVCGGDFSAYSAETSFYTIPAPYVCPMPTNLQAAKVYNNAALITWTAGDDKQKEWWIEYKTTAEDLYTHFQTVNEPQVTISELDPETEYAFHVCAYHNGVISEYAGLTFTTTAATPCVTPLGIKLAGPASQHSAVVTWTIPDDAPDAWVLDYRSEYEDIFHSVEIVTPPYTLDGLEMSTRYDLRLKARCGDSFSDYTRVASFWTPGPDATCADPTGLQVSDVTASTAYITWTAGEEAQKEWSISYKRTDGVGYSYGQIVFDKPEITLIGLDGGVEYEVSVTGMCDIESGTISTTFTTKTPVCNAPTDAYLLMIREDGPVILWTPAVRQTAFNVYYKKASEASFVNSVTVSDNACTLTGLEYATDYEVQITGLCGAVESDPSNIVSFTMPAEPTGPACVAPTSIEVTNIYPTNVRVNWDVESLDYMDWEVMYKVKGSKDAPLSKHINGQQFTMLTGLEPETEYEVSVYTYCDAHLSTDAVSTTFTTAATPCPNPTNIHVSELTTTTALVMWNPGSSDNLYWSVYYYPTSTPDDITIMDTSDDPSYQLTGLTPDTEYGVRMLSFCDGEIGPGYTTPIIFCTMDKIPTDVEEVSSQESEIRTQKILRDGHLYIIYEGRMYDVRGARVK